MTRSRPSEGHHSKGPKRSLLLAGGALALAFGFRDSLVDLFQGSDEPPVDRAAAADHQGSAPEPSPLLSADRMIKRAQSAKEARIIERVAEYIRQMREGDLDGAEYLKIFLDRKYPSERELFEALPEYGLTKREYEMIRDALTIKMDLEFIETFNPQGRFQSDLDLNGLKIWRLLGAFHNEHPFDPLFLKFLGMDEQTLKDRVQEILIMSEDPDVPSPYEEPSVRQQIRDSVRQAYGISN